MCPLLLKSSRSFLPSSSSSFFKKNRLQNNFAHKTEETAFEVFKEKEYWHPVFKLDPHNFEKIPANDFKIRENGKFKLEGELFPVEVLLSNVPKSGWVLYEQVKNVIKF